MSMHRQHYVRLSYVGINIGGRPALTDHIMKYIAVFSNYPGFRFKEIHVGDVYVSHRFMDGRFMDGNGRIYIVKHIKSDKIVFKYYILGFPGYFFKETVIKMMRSPYHYSIPKNQVWFSIDYIPMEWFEETVMNKIKKLKRLAHYARGGKDG